MKCPRDDIYLTKISRTRIGAEGCEKHVLYVWISEDTGWIANTTGKRER